MNFGNLVPGIPHHFWEFLAHLGRHPGWLLMRPKTDDDSVDLKVDSSAVPHELRPRVVRMLARAEENETWGNDVLCMESLAALCRDGTKVFTASAEQCEALEHVELRLRVEEYRQPYPAMLVRFPKEFVETISRDHGFTAPQMIGVRHYEKVNVLFFHGIFHDLGTRPEGTADNCLICVNSETRTIEESTGKVLDSTDREAAGMRRMYRVAANLMLLLADSAHRLVPSGGKTYEKARRTGRDRIELGTHVHNVVTDTVIIVRRYEHSEPGDGTHTSPRPHWRKGHWRAQRHGEGNSLVKRIFIRPVFVRGDDAEGGDDFVTEYKA